MKKWSIFARRSTNPRISLPRCLGCLGEYCVMALDPKLLTQIVKHRVLPHGVHDPHPCHPNLFETPHEIPLVFGVALTVSVALFSRPFA